MLKSKNVEDYIEERSHWKAQLNQLRAILLSTELEETIKWGAPIYCIEGKNVVGLAAFSQYAGLWFYNGVYLNDPHNFLINAQEGTTKAMRQLRFKHGENISTQRVRDFVEGAIANQKAGIELKPEQSKPLIIPRELNEVLQEDSVLAKNFDSLNLTRKREFAEYISEAKRISTKQTRLQKIIPMIDQGIGLNDKYRQC